MNSPLTGSDIESELGLTQADISATFDPFVWQRWVADDPEFVSLTKAAEAKWNRRRWRRRLFGWLPSSARLPRILRGRRTKNYVRDSYTETWSKQEWPQESGTPDPKKLSLGAWHDQGYLVRRGAVTRSHMTPLARAIELLKPRTVLEVGSGAGLNLFALSARFPDIAWTGIELTETGISRAKAVQKEARLPTGISKFCPWPVADPEAFRRIKFLQEDATQLPFEDNSFDLVFTRQALEQIGRAHV